jgi:hypothetical protein
MQQIEREYSEEVKLQGVIVAGINRKQKEELAYQKYLLDTNRIDREQTDELNKLKIENIIDEEKRIEAKYNNEERLLRDKLRNGEITEEEYNERMIALMRGRAKELYSVQQRYLQGLLEGLSALEQGLASISGMSDSLVVKLLRAAQIALEIANRIGSMQNSEGSGAGDFLAIAGSVLKIFGLFDKGGYTGEGGRYEPAGIVHKGEYVFEKPIVDKVGIQNFERLHSALRSYATGGYVGESISSSALLREMRALRQEVRLLSEKPIVNNVNLYGTLSGQKFLSEEYPKYQRYVAKKNL